MRALRMPVLVAIAVLVLVYVAYCMLLWSKQRAMMFPGAHLPVKVDRSDWPPGADTVRLQSTGSAVDAIWLPAATTQPTGTMMFFHGNAEFAFQSVASMSKRAGTTRNLLLLEYPGYAGAPGTPSLSSLRDASIAAYDWLLKQPTVDAQRIVAIGRSVGGGPAAELSRHRPLAALVLMSTFTSVADMARSLHVPAILIRDPFDNYARVAAFASPVLVLHGRHDEVIPFEQGLMLGRASPRTEFVALDCAHNDCDLKGSALWTAVSRFLASHRL